MEHQFFYLLCSIVYVGKMFAMTNALYCCKSFMMENGKNFGTDGRGIVKIINFVIFNLKKFIMIL